MGFLTRTSELYSRHPRLIGALIGGLMGFFVLSPLAMVVEHITHTHFDTLGEHLRELLLLRDPGWSMLFTALGASSGLMYGSLARRIDILKGDLFKAEKLATVGQLAAGVAHEINTPLSNISLNAESARMKNRDAGVGANLDEITRQVDIASQIVRDMLEFSSPARVEFVEVDINELLRRTVALVRGRRKEDVRIVERYAERLPDVRGEPNQVQHVFLNLMNNAYDAMPEGGELEVSTASGPGGQVSIDFRDTGCGIPEENLKRIFDPFFTTKGPGKGTGLGLSICHSIVQAHGGRIDVSSRVGEGTNVTVLLPR